MPMFMNSGADLAPELRPRRTLSLSSDQENYLVSGLVLKTFSDAKLKGCPHGPGYN